MKVIIHPNRVQLKQFIEVNSLKVCMVETYLGVYIIMTMLKIT